MQAAATSALSVGKRSYPMFGVRGRSREDPIPEGGSQEEPPLDRSQGRWPGGATPRLRVGAVARRSNPTSKEWWLHGRRRA